MSEKTYIGKWKGKDTQRVRGAGLFEPNKDIELTAEQAAILKGVNSPLFEIREISPKKSKEK